MIHEKNFKIRKIEANSIVANFNLLQPYCTKLFLFLFVLVLIVYGASDNCKEYVDKAAASGEATNKSDGVLDSSFIDEVLDSGGVITVADPISGKQEVVEMSNGWLKPPILAARKVLTLALLR